MRIVPKFLETFNHLIEFLKIFYFFSVFSVSSVVRQVYKIARIGSPFGVKNLKLPSVY